VTWHRCTPTRARPSWARCWATWPGARARGISSAAWLGVSASGVEYFDEPALVLMLADIPREHFRVFSGQKPLGASFDGDVAQVHADPRTPELGALLGDLAGRTRTGYLFGGLASARTRTLHIADAVLEGGLSGVAFDAAVPLVSRGAPGCPPVGPARPRRRRAAAAAPTRAAAPPGPAPTTRRGSPAPSPLSWRGGARRRRRRARSGGGGRERGEEEGEVCKR